MDKYTEERVDYETDFLSIRSNVEVTSALGECLGGIDKTNNGVELLADTNVVKRKNIKSDGDDSTRSNVPTSSNISSEREDSIGDRMDLLSIQDTELFNDLIFQQDADGDNLLFLTIIDGQISLTMRLISLVCDVQGFGVCNKFLQTALHIATLMNMASVTRRLVVAGANVDRRDRNGNTALHLACKNGTLDLAEVLLRPVTYQETKLNSYEIPYQKIPQNLEVRNSDGLTCLHLAVLNQNQEMISLLLSKDADVNAIEMKAGKTCLHIAAENGDLLTVCNLLQCSKLEVDKETFAGYTAAELAFYRGHEQVETVLSIAGASPSRSITTVETSRVCCYQYDSEEGVEIIEISSDDNDANEDDCDDDDDEAFAKQSH